MVDQPAAVNSVTATPAFALLVILTSSQIQPLSSLLLRSQITYHTRLSLKNSAVQNTFLSAVITSEVNPMFVQPR
jgi:hypothetical protein